MKFSDLKKPIHIFEGFAGVVCSLLFSLDDQLLLSRNFGETVKLWNLKNGTIVGALGSSACNSMVLAGKKDHIFVALKSKDGLIEEYDINNKKLIRKLEYHGQAGAVSSLAGNHESHFLLSGDTSGKILLNNLQNNELKTLYKSLKHFHFLAINKDSNQCLILQNTDQFYNSILYDLSKMKRVATLKSSRYGAFSPNGEYVALQEKNSIDIYSTKNGNILRTLVGHGGRKDSIVRTFCFSSDSKYIVSGADDKTLRIWDVNTGETVRTLKGHTDAITAVAISHDSRYIASGSNDETLRLWHGTEVKPTEEKSIPRAEKSSNSMVVSKDEWDRVISDLNNYKKRTEKLESMVEKLFRSQENTKEDSETKNAVVKRDSFEDF